MTSTIAKSLSRNPTASLRMRYRWKRFLCIGFPSQAAKESHPYGGSESTILYIVAYWPNCCGLDPYEQRPGSWDLANSDDEH